MAPVTHFDGASPRTVPPPATAARSGPRAERQGWELHGVLDREPRVLSSTSNACGPSTTSPARRRGAGPPPWAVTSRNERNTAAGPANVAGTELRPRSGGTCPRPRACPFHVAVDVVSEDAACRITVRSRVVGLVDRRVPRALAYRWSRATPRPVGAVVVASRPPALATPLLEALFVGPCRPVDSALHRPVALGVVAPLSDLIQSSFRGRRPVSPCPCVDGPRLPYCGVTAYAAREGLAGGVLAAELFTISWTIQPLCRPSPTRCPSRSARCRRTWPDLVVRVDRVAAEHACDSAERVAEHVPTGRATSPTASPAVAPPRIRSVCSSGLTPGCLPPRAATVA